MNLKVGFKGKGRIKVGTPVFQDCRSLLWPECVPPGSEYKGEEYKYQTKSPDRIFDIELTSRGWDCKADGYGYLKFNGDVGDYGNGSILVINIDGVEVLEEITEPDNELKFVIEALESDPEDSEPQCTRFIVLLARGENKLILRDFPFKSQAEVFAEKASLLLTIPFS